MHCFRYIRRGVCNHLANCKNLSGVVRLWMHMSQEARVPGAELVHDGHVFYVAQFTQH